MRAATIALMIALAAYLATESVHSGLDLYIRISCEIGTPACSAAAIEGTFQ